MTSEQEIEAARKAICSCLVCDCPDEAKQCVGAAKKAIAALRQTQAASGDDRERAREVAAYICGCANPDQREADVRHILAYGRAEAERARIAAIKRIAELLDAVAFADNTMHAIVENDPDDCIADGGITVWHGVEQSARRWLARYGTMWQAWADEVNDAKNRADALCNPPAPEKTT